MRNYYSHHRRSIRLPEYDYAQPGAYFVTIVAFKRECLFSNINDEVIDLSPIGKIIERAWLRLPSNFPVCLDAWIIMPNHFHGIIQILDKQESLPAFNFEKGRGEASATRYSINPSLYPADASPTHPAGTRPASLGAIIQNFKSTTTRQVNHMRASPGAPIWQRNYFEHIIRKEAEWDQIQKYIRTNSVNWLEDDLFIL